MNKQDLRKAYLAKRTELSAKDKLRLDDLLLLQFQQMNYGDVRTLLTYWPKADSAEPNTHLFSRYLRFIVPSLQIAYPKTDTQTHTMQALSVDDDSVYLTNKWGITEPKEGLEVHPGDIDLVFVPMLACDMEGHRVGYGKGFYDRYLAECRDDAIKIGFSYFEPIERIPDTGQFDVPLNYCITPQEIYEF